MSDDLKIILVEFISFGATLLGGLYLYNKMSYPKVKEKKD